MNLFFFCLLFACPLVTSLSFGHFGFVSEYYARYFGNFVVESNAVACLIMFHDGNKSIKCVKVSNLFKIKTVKSAIILFTYVHRFNHVLETGIGNIVFTVHLLLFLLLEIDNVLNSVYPWTISSLLALMEAYSTHFCPGDLVPYFIPAISLNFYTDAFVCRQYIPNYANLFQHPQKLFHWWDFENSGLMKLSETQLLKLLNSNEFSLDYVEGEPTLNQSILKESPLYFMYHLKVATLDIVGEPLPLLCDDLFDEDFGPVLLPNWVWFDESTKEYLPIRKHPNLRINIPLGTRNILYIPYADVNYFGYQCRARHTGLVLRWFKHTTPWEFFKDAFYWVPDEIERNPDNVFLYKPPFELLIYFELDLLFELVNKRYQIDIEFQDLDVEWSNKVTTRYETLHKIERPEFLRFVIKISTESTSGSRFLCHKLLTVWVSLLDLNAKIRLGVINVRCFPSNAEANQDPVAFANEYDSHEFRPLYKAPLNLLKSDRDRDFIEAKVGNKIEFTINLNTPNVESMRFGFSYVNESSEFHDFMLNLHQTAAEQIELGRKKLEIFKP